MFAWHRLQLFLKSAYNKRADIWPMSTMATGRSLDESDASMRQRLVNSLSQSFPGSALSRALHCMDSDSEDMKTNPLSSSCFSELRLVKGEMDDDDELTSLAWLQDTNLIKNINAGEVDEQFTDEDGQKENGDIRTVVPTSAPVHPPHVPYNPQKHINSKPPYSFSCLIFMAIEESPQKSLPVKDIYSWILKNFPYFLNAPTGWKNSVRHNLSLNKCFKKVEKDKGQQSIGKGSLWCIDPDYRPNLLQALRKTPYHPYHQLQMLASNQSAQTNANNLSSSQCNAKPVPLAPKLGPNSLSPHLFPFLSKRLAQSRCDLDSDIHDVAYTLMSMKGFNNQNSGQSADVENSSETSRVKLKRKQRGVPYGPVRKKMSGPIICTTSPSEDHTYSATSTPATDDDSHDVSSSSIDDEYDFGPEADDEDEDDDDEEEEEEEDYTDFDSYHSDFEEGSVSGEEEENSTPTRSAAATVTTPTTLTPTNTTSAATATAATTVTTLPSTGLQQRSPRCSTSENKDRLNSRQYRSKKHLLTLDEDEKKKIAEGADALLNLAGIKTSEMTAPVGTAAVTMPAQVPAASEVVPECAFGSLFSESQTNAECWTELSRPLPESSVQQTVS